VTLHAHNPARPEEAPPPPPPRRIRGAIWQAGVTPRSHRRKVLLDGSPLPLCFAAGANWALCYPEPQLQQVKPTPRAPLGLAYLIDEFKDAVLKQGVVSFVRCDD
jgi:hypothetical protein